MEHEEIFNETLKSLGIRNVYTDGFNPEQIFFQLDNATSNLIESLEREINKEYSKFSAKNKSSPISTNSAGQIINNPSSEETVSDVECNVDESKSVFSDKETGDADDSSREESNADLHMKGELEESSSLSESLGSELNCSSEEAVSFETSMWVESNSSNTELINEPAHEVLQILRGRKRRKGITK